MYRSKPQAVALNSERIICEVRLWLLALSMAIAGLVLAPLGRVG